MSYATPVDGIYRIKIPADNSLYMQLADDGSRVLLSALDVGSNQQMWNVRQVNGKLNTYKITSLDGVYTLSWATGGSYDVYGHGYLLGKVNATTEWTVEFKSPYGPRILTGERQGYYVDSCDHKAAHFWSDAESGFAQHWAFEPIQGGPVEPRPHVNSFQNKFFNLTVEQAAQQPPGKEYDIIIIGSGVGGGVLANDLYDTNLKVGNNAKRVLLLEKGGLVFHSHCLNTARPAGLANDRGQQNDTFFHQFKENYTFNPPLSTDVWNGGPMYNLGGRSAAWGLFAPRVHESVLEEHFHKDVYDDLRKEFYDKAERLMLLSLPTTKRIHQHIMDRLNMDGLAVENDSQVQWQWGRIASEFHDDRNFDFAEGAYSTIDKILEIAMSRPTVKKDGVDVPVEHEYFKTAINADVRSLSFREDKTVKAVNVRTLDGKEVPINVKPGANVVLCAGSVQSPTILLRSGVEWKQKLREHRGLHLTDHDILFYTCSFRYSDPQQRQEYGAMKLQTYVDIGQHIALANMSIDASSFLPRGQAPDDDLPQFIMVFILQRKLNSKNDISLDPNTQEPVVKMERGKDPTQSQLNVMANLTASAMNSLKESAGLSFIGFEDRIVDQRDITLKKLQLGGVAHELGTLPMDDESGDPFCLDQNLCMDDDLCKGVYVCDLSCFPYSPESNPTLTLAALAIRLSRHLIARTHVETVPENAVSVVNHSGSKVRVWLTNYNTDLLGGDSEAAVALEPGEEKNWTRQPGVAQGLFVFKLDQAKQDGSFLTEPVILTAHPKKVTAIQP